MATLIVMDHNGDTRHEFNAVDAQELLKAEARFKELTGAVLRRRPERLTRMFDPTADETLFFPRLVGG